MQQRLYPLGQQDFPGIINEGRVYVDKTMHAHRLITTNKYYFCLVHEDLVNLYLSACWRLYFGKAGAFKGMYIYDKWPFEPYPIISLSFNTLAYENNQLDESIKKRLHFIAASYAIELKTEETKEKFEELIKGLYKKYNKNVVILIDEYDKPLIDYLDKANLHKALENRDILKRFYSVLKDADPYLKLVFITGVSKFSKVSIFSDLNNLTDLSLADAYNEICGISQKELEENFVEELKAYDKEKIRKWYNGYKWDMNGFTVYNPFSLLSFFVNNGKYQNFWYTTGTPTFLMKMCREQHLYKFEEISINQDELGNFDIENLKIIPILFQTGYLTIKSENPILRNYKLSFPNQEVRESYLRNLADQYIGSNSYSSSNILESLLESLNNNDADLLKMSLNMAFAQIPYDLWQKENEQYYHAIVHLLFSLLNVYIFSEVHTQQGRADAIVIYEDQIYCMEFKLDQSAQDALDQIKSRGYTERFRDTGKPIHHIGINFSSEQKKVDDIIW
ncbi:MAG: AAA family ATPase [Saprospiraceae bacterium]|nr:AAA family ATPase [Saprospiraceae bacterium]